MRGHAIEARICAENPDANFLPATGTLQVARWPEHVAFERSDSLPRVDSGVREGDAISPHYDSMIAKLIVWGEDRAQALARLDAALQATHIMGLHTNVAFLRRVVGSQAFATADLDTALIERERPALFEAPPLPLEWPPPAVVAHRWPPRPAGRRRPLVAPRRLAAAGRRAAPAEPAGAGPKHTLRVDRLHDGATALQIGAQRWAFSRSRWAATRFDMQLGNSRFTAWVYRHGERFASSPARAVRWSPNTTPSPTRATRPVKPGA
jgi:3-methylcrotonyl-CoA carboxylase alpha subunit